MKKLLIIVLVTPLLAFAQGEYKTGARIGIGQSIFPNLNEASEVIHLMAGFNSTYQFNENLGVSAELLFNSIGTEYNGIQQSGGIFQEDQAYTGDLRLVSINIPIYPTLAFGTDNFKFTVHGGPSMNFNVFGWESRDFEDDDIEDTRRQSVDDYESLYFTVVYGAGVRIKTNKAQYVFMDFRINNSLMDVYTFGQNDTQTATGANYFSISTGYIF